MSKGDQITFEDIILAKPSETLLNEITEDLMKDGFNCYRTLHANLPLKSKYTRATLLFHYGNPHHDPLLLNFIAKIYYFSEKVQSKK